MSELILRIPQKKYDSDTTVVPACMPQKLLTDTDAVANISDRKHTEILLQEGNN